jgi:hypothetical protein
MKINIKLKIKIIDFLLNHKSKESHCISYLPLEDQEKIFSAIESYLKDDSYFVYKDGTKFNSELLVVPKNKMRNYFNNDYIIYTIDTLDTLSVGETDSLEMGTMLEIYTTGRFDKLLYNIKDICVFNAKESKFPE